MPPSPRAHPREVETTAPTPSGTEPWEGWAGHHATARALVEQLTLAEAVSLVSAPMGIGPDAPADAVGSAAHTPGVERLGIPGWDESDASLGVTNPMGARGPDDDATAFPSGPALAATFDPDLARQVGEAVGAEAHAHGVAVQLAGGMNLVRDPRGGRVFEYLSEDVLLSGVLAGASVAGIQSRGVAATLKHFALNPSETGRVVVSSDLSEPALRESDLLAFQIAHERGRPRAVMPGYNLVNGVYASESHHLLTQVLKGDWGFGGFVMSDWGATHSTVHAAVAGLDRQSGHGLDTRHFFGADLLAAVESGRVPRERLDDMVTRILTALASVGALGERRRPRALDLAPHAALAARVAAGSVVLLRNTDHVLPLAGTGRLLVVGAHADTGVISGGGSSTVTPPGTVTDGGSQIAQMELPRAFHAPAPLDALRERWDGEVSWLDGADVPAAVAAAGSADTVVVVAEKWSTEGQDSPDLSLGDGQDELITALAAANDRLVVVLTVPSAVTMPWLDDVAAVLVAWYGGQAGAGAIADVLTGVAPPAGRLPITFPRSESQLPRPDVLDPAGLASNPGEPRRGGYPRVSYDVEGADVGYRWFERERLDPLFPFGAGLSTTTVEWSQVSVAVEDGAPVATLTLTNTGTRAGVETPQVYVAPPALPDRSATRRLAGWARVALEPGESRTVSIRCDEPRVLSAYDADDPGWTRAAGRYAVRVARDAAARPVLEAEVELPRLRLAP